MTPVSAPNRQSELALRDQLSNLQGLLALSMIMTERRSEDDIVHLATTAVPSLGRCRIDGVFQVGFGWRATAGSCTRPAPRAQVQAQLTRLAADGGALTIAGQGWAWAFALRSLAGHFGFLVVTADQEPSDAELFLLRVLAQQTATALANAGLHAGERAATAELRSANAALAQTVAALQRKTAIHDRLTRVAVAGEGRAGIARALHELTGLAAGVEDRHGNLLAWSGPEPVRPPPKVTPTKRAHLLERALVAGRPIRADGRLVVVARTRGDVLGVVALADPDGRAGEQETVALEHAATVLAVELAWLQNVADAELRLGRDIVSDLINGIDSDSALERARAVGHDLGRPHRVLLLDAPGHPDTLVVAVRQAVREHRVTPLLLPQTDAVVVLAPGAPDDMPRWERLRAAVLAVSGATRCRVGVGGIAERPSEFPRSHREARLALRLHDTIGGADRAVCYDELGVYQLLGELGDTGGVERFVRRWLGDLLDYDGQHRTDLVATVSRYLECGGNYDATARALALGRSTVKYRLRRIRQISGHDLSRPDTRFNLQLATRALGTLHALGEPLSP
ncbi:MAG: hypothetical protein QOF00_2837 [Pseudonocardiales bacterium]|nr:hypothetical protein [Pseudonocardiales bacterium]